VKRALLDVNTLMALQWPAHQHHEAAHRWYAKQPARRWASCPLTQLAFVRLVSNPAVTRDALSPPQASELLAQAVAHPAHEFWPDDLPIPVALGSLETVLQGYQQMTDAYLLAMAHRRGGALATFDRGLRALAGRTLEGAVEIIPAH
jgi:uncharacterized protein